MRAAGSAPASKPVLSATVDIAAGQAYTAAGTGLYQALRLQVRHDRLAARLQVRHDRLAAPHGKALLQVIQASLHQQRVTVSFGSHPVATNLAFGRATGFRAVSPGRRVLRAAGPGEHAAAAVTLAAGSIHTVAVLDEPGRLAIRVLADTAGSTRDPAGGPATGLGGTAPQPGSALTLWITAASCGLLLIAVGLTRPRWSRPTHPSRPAATASASTVSASTGPARPRHAGTQPARRAR